MGPAVYLMGREPVYHVTSMAAVAAGLAPAEPVTKTEKNEFSLMFTARGWRVEGTPLLFAFLIRVQLN